MKIAILTSKSSWFYPYALEFLETLKEEGFKESQLFTNHELIPSTFDIVFILSYFSLIPQDYLAQHQHNLVVHESDLPRGKGWAPLFWQILEGKNQIPIVLFEATPQMDDGPIYFKDYLHFEGHELNPEIRKIQATKTRELCLRFLKLYPNVQAHSQTGPTTSYPKRTPKESELNIHESLQNQFNLLRIVNNTKFPAFFHYKGHKYVLTIHKHSKHD